MAPRAPALQPPNSRRVLGMSPNAKCVDSVASVASMMRCPWNAHPSVPATFLTCFSVVACCAPMLPTQASELQ